MKYTIPDNEAEQTVLPNLLGLTTAEEVAVSEFIGFVDAQQRAVDRLSDRTVFNLSYLYRLHKNALGHLYGFAGKLRTVNMSKDAFHFPPASFLSQAMSGFETEFLHLMKDTSTDNNILIVQLARMHAELLFIHPFREGNGRTIRLFTNMIYLSKTGKEFDFESLLKRLPDYITAVQHAGKKEYALMERLFIEMTSEL